MNRMMKSKQVILVLGCHRSGTSALTGALQLLGCGLPSRLHPGDASNPKGYFEPWAIAHLHEEIFREVGSKWDDPTEILASWFETEQCQSYIDRLIEVIHEDFADLELPVLKEPRLCKLLPMWRTILARMGLQPLIINIARRPVEVAESLKSRDGFPLRQGLLIWLRNQLDSEFYTRDYVRTFLSFDDLLKTPFDACKRIESDLNIVFPNQSELTEEALKRFLDPNLKHHDESAICTEKSNLLRFADSAYQLFEKLHFHPKDNSAQEQLSIHRTILKSLQLRDSTGSLLSTIANSPNPFAVDWNEDRLTIPGVVFLEYMHRYIFASAQSHYSVDTQARTQLETALSARDQQIGSLHQELVVKERELASLRQKIVAKDQRATSLNQKLDTKDQELASLSQKLDTKDQQLTALSQLLDFKDQNLTSLRQQLNSKDQQLTSLEREFNAKDQQLTRLSEEHKASKQQVSSLREELNTKERQANSLDQDLFRKDQQLSSLSQELALKERQVKSLQETSQSQAETIEQLRAHDRYLEQVVYSARLWQTRSWVTRAFRKWTPDDQGIGTPATPAAAESLLDVESVSGDTEANAPPRYASTVPQYIAVVPFEYEIGPRASTPKIAVILHLYYIELLEEFKQHLLHIRPPFDLFITTDTEEKRSSIHQGFAGWTKGTLEVRLAPNRGRDIAPKLITCSDVYERYEYFLHIHTKKTVHNENLEGWREYLLKTLLGSEKIVDCIFEAFACDAKLGIIAAEHFPPLNPIYWAENFEVANKLAGELDIRITRNGKLDFPSGSMFWGRSAAIKPLLERQLVVEDFPLERKQRDGTLGHAIERLYFFICEKAGYRWIKVADAALLSKSDRLVQISSLDKLRTFIQTAQYKLLESEKPRFVRKPKQTPVPQNTDPAELIRTSGLFDPVYYGNKYADVVAAGVDLFDHYVKYGRFERRTPSAAFDPEAYFAGNPDLDQRTIEPLYHYLSTGRAEGRPLAPIPFPPTIEYIEAKDQFIAYQANPPIDAIVKLIAFYLPQFHPFPENDLWWGKGFTEWANVGKAKANYNGHYQPHCPIHLGYYDLRLPEVMKEQARLAQEYGVYGFSYYFYWFGGKILMDTPLEMMLRTPEIDIPFCLTWANENWNRRWDGLENELLIAQRHSSEDSIAFIRHIIKYFQDNRYIKIDGRPVLVVYRADIIPDIAKTAELWREEIVKHGFPGIYLICAQSFGILGPEPFGFDASLEFPPHGLNAGQINYEVEVCNPHFKGRIYSYNDAMKFAIDRAEPEYKLFRTCMLAWDNTARRQNDSSIFHHFSLAAYQEWLKTNYQRVSANPKYSRDEKIVFVNAWNEWAEGTHLEPDRKFGYGYLQATYEALKSSTPAAS